MDWVSTASVVALTIQQSTMIFLLDFAPEWVKRWMLGAEYSGEALERRVQMRIAGGWRMVRALYHMNSINTHPQLVVGDAVPTSLAVESIRSGRVVGQSPLRSLTRGTTPLMINFG